MDKEERRISESVRAMKRETEIREEERENFTKSLINAVEKKEINLSTSARIIREMYNQ